MSVIDIRLRPRTLYIIAPSLFQCYRTATAWGLKPPAIVNTRNITSAYQLRGVGAGTPFITHGREHWGDSEAGYELDQVLTAYQRLGRLRIAQEDDLAACRLYADLPSLPGAPDEPRVAL